MINHNNLIFIGLLFIMLTSNCATKGLPRADLPAKSVTIRIIHTNDLHSPFDIYKKLSAFIEDQKVSAIKAGLIPVVTDSGDFSSGSIVHVVGPNPNFTMNPELEFLRKHKAQSTFGNHEWDATQKGLAHMMSKLGSSFPGGIVATNIVLGNDAQNRPNALLDYFFDGIMIIDSHGRVKEAFVGEPKSGAMIQVAPDDITYVPITRALIREYASPEGNIIKIGYIGVMGPNAVEGSKVTRKETGVGFDNYAGEGVKDYVARLRDLGAEIIIALCHGGTQEEGLLGAPEDKNLAQEITGIDIVAAGHTHAAYKATEVGKFRKQFIFQSGAHGQAVISDILYTKPPQQAAHLSIVKKSSRLINFEIINNSDSKNSLISDYEIKSWQKAFDQLLHNSPALYTLEANTLRPKIRLSHDTRFININSLAQSQEALGKLITTAILDELNSALATRGEPALQLFMMPIALINRLPSPDKPTLFADIFAMLSRGTMKNSAGTFVPDGGKITAMSMKKEDLYRLISLLDYYARNIDSQADMAYSQGTEYAQQKYGIVLINNLKNLKVNNISYEQLPDIIRLAMPSFVATHIKDTMGGFVNALIAHQINPREIAETMDILFARDLYKRPI